MTDRYSHINNTESNYYVNHRFLFLTIEILILKTEFHHQMGPFLIHMANKFADKSDSLIENKTAKKQQAMPNHTTAMSRSSTRETPEP
jgi:hypothetical protein